MNKYLKMLIGYLACVVAMYLIKKYAIGDEFNGASWNLGFWGMAVMVEIKGIFK